MRYHPHHFIIAAALAFLMTTSSSLVLAESGSNANAWLKNYKQAPADARMVSRVQAIFEDVKRANDSVVHPSKLYIIESNSTPWAIALKDRNVILTTGAIDIIYNSDGSLYEQDARMAFVLGHELKHVIENDFLHHKAFLALTESADSDVFSMDTGETAERKTMELRADEEGLIHASLAGYDMSAIFSEVGGANNFLEHWAVQTNTVSGSRYASPQERIDYLWELYESTESKVEFFRYGVRLAHFGDYENALVLLEDFYKYYDSDRVLTNRGYVHLQLARAAMDEAVAYRYWFPDLLDLDSGFPVSVSRSIATQIPENARRHLQTAVKLLTEGLSYSQNDLFTRMNLITAHLFLKEYSAARAVIEKIDNWEAQPRFLALDAIITMQDKRIKNPWESYSLELVEQLAKEPDAPHNLIYNYARLLQENGRSNEAAQYWSRLMARLSALPKNYQVMVCRQLDNKEQCAKQIQSFSVQHRPLKLALNPGENVNSKKARKLIKAWNIKPIETFSGIDAKIYPDNNNRSRLVVDDKVKLVTVGNLDSDVNQLVDKYGQPEQIINTGLEQIWSYGPHWSALVVNNKVRELWVAQ